MSNNSVLKTKSFDFAVRVVKLYRFLKKKQPDYELLSQFLRSGTAIGAMIREAEHAQSRKDFIHKLQISLKEANETMYWLELFFATEYLNRKMFDSIYTDAVELLKMLIASIKTTKSRSSLSSVI